MYPVWIALQVILPARTRAESLALNAAIAWIKNRRRVTSIDDLVATVWDAKPHPAVA